LVHLFNFGEAFEGAFERWLIDRKAEGWSPGELIREPADGQQESVAAAFDSLELDLGDGTVPESSQNGCVVLGRIARDELGEERRRLELTNRLLAGYSAGSPGSLVVPYLRLERS